MQRPRGLAYLGITANEARSVWLSATGAGSFQLESAQGSQTVDQWQRSRRGLRVTLSPVVSNGNGGVHQLLVIEGNRPCMIDSQNQKGGITFPSFIRLPELRPPGGIRPPGGSSIGDLTPLTPSVPGGITAPIATLPPTGAMPTLPGRPAAPPSGVMPTRPGGVAPPMATRPPTGAMPARPALPAAPPSGAMPTIPGRVAPPIATLPPSGVMPTVPGGVAPPIATLPPRGVMPTMPGGVAPPIAMLPPSGVPGGVAPPVATLPPGGAMPARPALPSAPPSGVMPALPGGVAPPVATLPPTGAMPTMPGGVAPPIATLPPSGLTPGVPTTSPPAVTPTLPGGVTPPVATLPPTGLSPAAPVPPTGTIPSVPTAPMTPVPAIDDTTLARREALDEAAATCAQWTRDGRERDVEDYCDRITAEQAQSGFGQSVPITPGREFATPTRWNLWFDGRALDTSDERHGLDTDGSGSYFTLGADRRYDNDVVAGLLVSYETNESNGFDGNLRQETDGYGIGAYIAQALSPRWAMDASAVHAWLSNDTRIAVLDGSYDSTRVSLALNTTGQYQAGEFTLRPKFTLSYSHYDNDAHPLSGVVFDTPIALQVAQDSFDNGTIEGHLEVSRTVHTASSIVIPYGELGASYAFIRPQDGGILTSDLRLASTSAWLGSMRVGARALVSQAMFVEASAGYLSLGQSDNDVWEFRLFLSWAF
ncbi:autotransporter domain-containing protein [Lysobacter sp. MMG2]|uniref:autotransporter outer membrane beta-barrel domain-containing protein n=1 Tax=Lysobacter sp. MMG2 TaxID=2801338 RepID=UPI001C218353|nr:autotransporter domain-containing protein [Lysobacter sp. MMG2]